MESNVLPKKAARALRRFSYWQRLCGKLGLSKLYWRWHMRGQGVVVRWRNENLHLQDIDPQEIKNFVWRLCVVSGLPWNIRQHLIKHIDKLLARL